MGQKKAARLQKASHQLARAVVAHAETVLALAESNRLEQVVGRGQHLRKAIRKYADAQFDVAGISYPFGAIYAESDELSEISDEGLSGSGASVILRLDFGPSQEGVDDIEELTRSLATDIRHGVLRLCSERPGVNPSALLVASVPTGGVRDLAEMAPVPSPEELSQALGSIDGVFCSDLDIFY